MGLLRLTEWLNGGPGTLSKGARITSSHRATAGTTPLARYLAAGNDALSPFVWFGENRPGADLYPANRARLVIA